MLAANKPYQNHETPMPDIRHFLKSAPHWTLVLLVAWLAAGCDFPQEVPPDIAPPRPSPRQKPVKPHPPRVTNVHTNIVKQPKPVAPGTIEYLDLKNGFRDTTFGQSEAEFSNLVLKEKDDARQLAIYTRTGDLLALDSVPLETIEYTFFKHRLYRIALRWKIEHPESVLTTPPSTELAASCSSLYGKPKRLATRDEAIKYSWIGEKVEIILHEFRMPGVANPKKPGWAISPTTSGQLVFGSVPLRHEHELFVAGQTQGGL